ncbi:MAG: SMC family ATPase [Armatimonadota bacterium]|nr:MAG: SMC family ATPase [Armatimonadota bacterium]
MIPVRLYLRDFMSYGEPGEELDFSFHTACLCGDNGNGKSALLDAMTWALWGRAPRLEGTQSKTEEVIRRADGVNEALVEFQFSVDDELYRVLRRLRRGRGQTLELYLSQGDSWRPLTGATKTDTQGVIQSLLGLDYHTFVMSSFLFQGRADSFTRAAPTERKEVLGGILRLDVYDELAKRARDLARECEGRAKQLADEVERLQAQADCEAEVEQRAQAAAAALAEAEKSLAQCDEGLEQARTRKATAERAAEELRRVEAGLKQAVAHADSLARQESGLRRRVEGYRAALAEEGAVREAMARLEQARERDADLSARREQAAEADSVRQQARAAIGAEQARLEQELQHAENAVAEARKAAGEADDVARQTAEFESQIRACQDAEAALESCREEMERLRTKRAADEQTERALRTELADIGARLEVLAKASARCPLCEQALGDELRKRLLTDARSLADSKEASADELTRAGEDAARTLKQLEAKMSSIQPHVARAGPLQKQLGELQRRAEEARAAGTKAERLEQRAQELRRMLESQSFAPEERRRLTAAEQRLAETAYEPAEHRRVQETIRALAGTEKKLGALEAARASLPQDEEHLAQV